MGKLSRPKTIILLILFLLWPLTLARASTTVGLKILHLNDTHGHVLPRKDVTVSPDKPVGGAAYFAEMIREERAKESEGTLLLSAGDMFQGTPISNVFRGQPVIEVMNALKFDAMALGNHEFDWGRDALKNLIASAAFPFLSATIVDRKGKLPAGIRPYVIVKRKGLRIALIGATTTETAYTTKPGNVSDLRFREPARVLPRYIKEAKARGAKLIVVLSHLGLDEDRDLAGKVAGIDLIVGGHSHTAVTEPVRERETLIVQAGSYGTYLGVVDLQVDTASGKIVEYTKAGVLKPVWAVADAPRDGQVAEIVARYDERIKPEFSKPVGESTVDLVRRQCEESNIGNLVTDAMREASGAEIAVQNSGGIRADLPRGMLTLESAYTLLPFDNVLVLMDLTGSQVLEALELSAAREAKGLQLSGLRVEYDKSREPGSRVVKAFVSNEPLKPEKTYRVVTNDFLASGGDNYTPFKEGKRVQFADDLRESFIGYVKRHSPVSPQIQGRITFIQ